MVLHFHSRRTQFTALSAPLEIAMISQQEILQIVCSEAVEFGGLQEIPVQKHGARQSFHALKRMARGPEALARSAPDSGGEGVQYELRLVLEDDGTLRWED